MRFSDKSKVKDLNYLTLIQDIDALINHHKMNEASKLLSEIDPKRLPSKYCHQMASLAVRLAKPQVALKFLWSRIFEDSNPSEAERFEYASALRKSGLINQSLAQLERLPSRPQYFLQQAFCQISRWNYTDAVRLLDEYLEMVEPHSKEFLVAQVNQIAGNIFLGQFDLAQEKLLKVTEQCKNKHLQLYLNCLELQGQIYLHTDQLELAEKAFSLATSNSETEHSSTRLFIKKWALILDIKAEKMNANDEKVKQFLVQARRQGHWETLRDWDFQISKVCRNHHQFVHNYFGSPFEGFRKRSLDSIGNFSLPQEYMWFDPRSKEKMASILDTYNPQTPHIPFGKNLHRLFMALCSDFYQPWSVERIYDVLFANEVFDPFSSKKRVYKQLEELRAALKDVPIEFRSTSHGYRLRPDPGVCLIIREKLQFPLPELFFKELITTHFSERLFKREDLQKVIPLNAHQCQRHLKQLSESGLIESVGQGKSIKYRLKGAS